MVGEKPNYTVAICNYNMADTLEESLRSILDQLNEEFEVLLVDDGSTDGSQEILDKLEEEYDIFRWIEGDNDNLAEARNHSFRESKGNYILESLDTDDKYKPVIRDFIEIFEQLNSQIGGEFFLSAHGMNIAPKSLLLEIPYRSMGYGEDRDLWRRLKSKDKIIPIQNRAVSKTLGYDRETVEKIKISMIRTIVEFQSGLGLLTYYRRLMKKDKVSEDYLRLIMLPVLYIYAKKEGCYSLPDDYSELEDFEELEKGLTLGEIEERYNVKINWSKVSELGEDKFNL